MNDETRWKWGEMYQISVVNKRFITPEATLSRAEDFCECFAMFKINSKRLEKFDEARYSFIKKVYSDLERIGEKNNEKT